MKSAKYEKNSNSTRHLTNKTTAYFGAFLLISSIFIGCNKSDEKKSTNYSYQHEENGCNTGIHTYTTNDELCEMLKNDELNNFCATSLRYEHFRTNCIGKSWQDPEEVPLEAPPTPQTKPQTPMEVPPTPETKSQDPLEAPPTQQTKPQTPAEIPPPAPEFTDVVELVCSSHSFAHEVIKCFDKLQNLIGVDETVKKACLNYSYPIEQENCLDKIGTVKVTNTTVAETCLNHSYPSEQQKCINRFHKRSIDERFTKQCLKFNYTHEIEKCLYEHSKATDETSTTAQGSGRQ